MECFLSLIALLIVLAAGLGTVLSLAPGMSRQSWSGLFGTALVVGAGIISLLSFVLGFFVRGALLKSILTGICIGLLVLGLRRGVRESSGCRRSSFGRAQIVLALVLVAQVCFVAWLSLYKSDLGWDGLLIWEAKAHIAFRHDGALPLQLYQGGYPVSITEYPVFLPMVQLWIYEWLGHIDQSMIKLIGPYLYLAAALILVSSARRASNTAWAAFIPLFLLPAVPQFMLGYGSAASGYADFPLGVVWLCAVMHLVEFCTTNSLSAARLTGASAAFLPFVKKDGVIALACIALAAVPEVFKSRSWKAAAWMLAPGFTIWLGWRIFLRVCYVPPPDIWLPVTWSTLITHLYRTGTIARLAAQELIHWERWSILWPTAIVTGVFLLIRRDSKSYALILNVLLPLLLYPCVFFFSSYTSVAIHVSAALPRLLIQNGLTAVLLISNGLMTLLQQETETEVSDPPAKAGLNCA